VIDLLLDNINRPFGIMDYDCFIFDPLIFTRLHDVSEKTLVNAVFATKTEN